LPASPKTTEPRNPKRRSTFGMLFNPHIGDSIRPIGQKASIIRPPDRAGVRHERPVPTQSSGASWAPWRAAQVAGHHQHGMERLSFTRKGLPKSAAVLRRGRRPVCSVLAPHHPFMLLFVARRNAQGFFTPPSRAQISLELIDYLFSPPPATQQAGGTALGAPIKRHRHSHAAANYQNTLWTRSLSTATPCYFCRHYSVFIIWRR